MRVDDRWLRVFLYSVAACNLMVLAGIFILPRLSLMLEHRDLSYSQRLQTSGPSDMPNQFSEVYRRFLKAGELIPVHARVFLPPKEGPRGTVRAPVLQLLYPRRIHFGDDVDFWERFEEALVSGVNFYFVFDAKWHPLFCAQDTFFKDEHLEWGVCRLGEWPALQRAGDL